MDRIALGKQGEDAAVAYLERSGYTIVNRNWRCKSGELDIIALDEETLVVVEVKTRRSEQKGSSEDAVTPSKQQRIERLTRAYIDRAGLSDISIRFDVIAIRPVGDDRALLRHHKAAFSAS